MIFSYTYVILNCDDSKQERKMGGGCLYRPMIVWACYQDVLGVCVALELDWLKKYGRGW